MHRKRRSFSYIRRGGKVAEKNIDINFVGATEEHASFINSIVKIVENTLLG